LLRWLTRRVLLTADAITVCAKHLAEEAQRIAGRELDIKLITNCVDIQYFLPAPEPAENRDHATLVHISNFNPKKKTTDIVEAFALAQISDSSRLVMVGNGPDYEATRELAKSLGIADRVNFAGAQKDVRPFLKEADLFVLASDDEGAPLVLLEAMASGLPWVSTPWGAAAILPPGECGLVVPANSPKKLAAAITELINDPERRFSMAKRGRQRAESDFSETTYVEEHCRVIREVEGK
jgi:glycosyltransferase involved in cell wall biosynthesis